MIKRSINCWEYKRCERQPGGGKVKELGVCPAAVDTSFDGINRGKNAGRICWAVAGTCCGGKVQGTFAEKRRSCTTCDFYVQVQEQEGVSNGKNNILKFFSEEETGNLLLDMTQCKFVRSGDKIVSQGEILDKAYIIQSGSCLVVVEKGGQLHPVDHRGRGDILGITSFLTGEPQTAHIEAETDVELWELEGSFLNSISTEHPELLDFLTEIVANRFDTARPIADREISKYIASEIIGRGAFSIVYSGIHAELNMPVTIKMMKHDLAMNQGFLHNFKNEAKIIAMMNHENIVRVYDIEERFRTVFIIMERLTGMTLDVLMKSVHTLPPQRVACFLIQICKGLRYAHQHGIVHQDIKPANLFVLPDDKIKILDFGLACPVGSENFLVGTPFYMSPEQVQCLPVDQRSDIYSLGLVAFEMLTGRKPFDGDDQFEVMEARANKAVPDPTQIVPSMPEELGKYIRKSCQRNPSDRYQNIDEALASLDSYAKDCALAGAEVLKPKRNIKMFYLIYGDDHHTKVKCALEEFNAKMRNMGVELKTGELVDL